MPTAVFTKYPTFVYHELCIILTFIRQRLVDDTSQIFRDRLEFFFFFQLPKPKSYQGFATRFSGTEEGDLEIGGIPRK